MAAKGRALLIAIATIVASSPVFASIPRSTVFDPPPIDRFAPDERHDELANDNARLMRAALDRALPASEPIESLAKTRVRAFGDLSAFERQPEPELTRALRQSCALRSVTGALGSSFAGGDPVNLRDASGLWQADFHYYLTLFLACAAGYTWNDSVAVATATERPDTDGRAPIDNFETTALHPGSKEALEAADRLRQWHFPKEFPNEGAVVPGSAEARSIMDIGYDYGDLDEFGEGLHPYQDSWSHQGVPSWEGNSGHRRGRAKVLTKANGLWPDADVPWRNPDIALSSAAASYTELVRFIDGHSDRFAKRATRMPFSSISGDVQQYIALKNKYEKIGWLKGHLAQFAPPGTNMDDIVRKYWNDVTDGPDDQAHALQLQQRQRDNEDQMRLRNAVGTVSGH